MGFFDISGDVVKQAEAAANFLLVEPPTAKGEQGGDSSWSEHGRIIETSSENFENEIGGKKCDVLSLQFKVEIDKEGSGLNEGNTFLTKLRINQYALQNWKRATKGSPEKGQHTMSQMAITRMKAIMKVCGIQPDMEDGGYSQGLISECFPPADSFSGVPSPLLGTPAFWFIVKKHLSTSKKEGQVGRVYTNYEIAQVTEG